MQWTPNLPDPYMVQTGILNTVHSLNLELAVFHVRQRIKSEHLDLEFAYVEDQQKLNKIRQVCSAYPPSVLQAPIISYGLTLIYSQTGVKSMGEYFASMPAVQPVEVWETVLAEQIKQLTESAVAILCGPETFVGLMSSSSATPTTVYLPPPTAITLTPSTATTATVTTSMTI